ncbi:unnamed protein product [Rhizopus microsporus]|uniref:Uncharacterized protein n=1 Tax=Rhizopus microsporus TaxID=58291 RepID=A0A0A1NDZ3_RHIZD|nr:hypothetical protein BCV71DRAFT_274698 [Rhizopus microsporus]CEI90719.1 hypothetical protein RMCBS344292_05034 [Rhizopus microsporus]
MLVPRVEPQSYLFISLSKILLLFQSGQLQDSNHKEGWFQGNVYADLFDPYYITKRTECPRYHHQILEKNKENWPK